MTERPLAEVSDERIEEVLPEGPISSVRDIQVLYGGLKTLVDAGGSGAEVHHSPSKIEQLDKRQVGDSSDRVVVVLVDPTESSVVGVEFEPYDHEEFRQYGYSYYSASRGADHSVTQRTAKDSDVERIADYATDRMFNSWYGNEGTQKVAESHDDGWIIDSLGELYEKQGDDYSADMEKVRDAVHENIGDKRQAIVTVGLCVDRDTVELSSGATPDPDRDYLYPGEVAVFEAAVRENIKNKFVDKNDAEEAEGEATGIVTGEEETVVGVAEDPLKYNLSKNMGRFWLLDADESWRTHPLSFDAASYLRKADDYIDACRQSSIGGVIYYLPYYQDISVDKARRLCRYLEAISDGESGRVLNYDLAGGGSEEGFRSKSVLSKLYDMDDNLRVYTAVIREYHKDKYWQYGDSLNASEIPPVTVAEEHDRLVSESSLFGDFFNPVLGESEYLSLVKGDTGSLPEEIEDQEHELEEWVKKLRDATASGTYFSKTFPEQGGDNLSVDDPHTVAQRATLGGETLDFEFLLREYAQRLTSDDQGEDLSHAVMQRTVLEQFAQLVTLARTGFIQGVDEQRFEQLFTMEQQQRDLSKPERRERRIETFLRENPLLADDAERRGVFLLGALVAEVSQYQYQKDVSQRLIDQHPVSSVSGTRVKRIVSDALDRLAVYSSEEGYGTLMYGELAERLPDYFETADPSDFDLTTSDMRYHYALGLAYGMSDSSMDDADADQLE